MCYLTLFLYTFDFIPFTFRFLVFIYFFLILCFYFGASLYVTKYKNNVFTTYDYSYSLACYTELLFVFVHVYCTVIKTIERRVIMSGSC